MLAWTRRRVFFIAVANFAAIVVGVGAAFATDARLNAPPASATHVCTHYTPIYFIGDTASQPHYCFAHRYIGPQGYMTDSWAPRDRNSISYLGSPDYEWWLWYAYPDSSYCCGLVVGHAPYAFAGTSEGNSVRAACSQVAPPFFADRYCTTLW